MIIQGDYLQNLHHINNKSVKLVLTDPPYWHTKSHRAVNQRDRGYHIASNSSIANTPLYRDDGDLMDKFSQFTPLKVNLFLDAMLPKMIKPNMYIFCNETILPHYQIWAEKNKLKTNIIVWEKPVSVLNSNRWSMNAEFIVRIYSGGNPLNKLKESWRYSRVQKQKPIGSSMKLHPTQKPVDLLESLLLLSSSPTDTIFDPFMGSGSTGIACLNTNRNFIGIEKDDKYFEVAKKRIEEAQNANT